MDYPKDEIIVLYIESTGKDHQIDEVLSLSMVNGNGEVLFDELIKPQHHLEWSYDCTLRPITWEDVASQRFFIEYWPKIAELISSSSLIAGSDIDHCLEMLENSGASFGQLNTFDITWQFAVSHHRWDDWQSGMPEIGLIECSQHYGIPLDERTSLAYAKALSQCLEQLTEDPIYMKFSEDKLARMERAKKRNARIRKAVEVCLIALFAYIFYRMWGCALHW